MLNSVFVAFIVAAPSSLPAPVTVALETWPRMRADKFGCYVEQTFGVRDARYNCALKHYKPRGDICGKKPGYDAGPVFPKSQVNRIHPLITDIQLSWEHGDLQDVSITVSGKHSKAKLMALLHLPKTNPDNVMRIDVQDCSAADTCLDLTGFDHQGAGDVDCGG